ncbi:MAG: DNA polymerase IV [Ruminococcaceae bacterium]|nr:DNA polymerase IV [Oscillospiraceae bacterium]
MERVVLHSDLNNFYASVECYLNPSLVGHPVAVAGDPEARHGIVLAKNYEAKKCGVKTGEALWEARLKCPGIIFVPPHYDKYIEYSNAVREIYGQYTDMVEPFGLDECWLDVTGSRNLFGDGASIADEIRDRVRRELGVTVSVGVSFNKIFAKLGSDMKKPDATTVIDRAHFKEKVWPLPACDLLYIGRRTGEKLSRFGINTIGDIANASTELLGYLLGKNGIMLHAFANGDDTSPVARFGESQPIKSLSCGHTAPRDLKSEDDIKIMLLTLATKVSSRLRSYGYLCRTVQIQTRSFDLSSYVRRKKLTYPCRTSREIYECALELFKKNHPRGIAVRSMSICVSDLSSCDGEQLSFEPELERIQRRENLECAFDRLRSRHGEGIIKRGLLMTDPTLCQITEKNHPGIMPGMMKMD